MLGAAGTRANPAVESLLWGPVRTRGQGRGSTARHRTVTDTGRTRTGRTGTGLRGTGTRTADSSAARCLPDGSAQVGSQAFAERCQLEVGEGLPQQGEVGDAALSGEFDGVGSQEPSGEKLQH